MRPDLDEDASHLGVSEMKFFCNYCGSAIQDDSVSVGQQVTCPTCHAVLQVPGVQLRQPQEPTVASDSKSVAAAPNNKLVRRVRQTCAFSLLFCFLVGATTAIASLLTSSVGEIQAKIMLTTVSLGAYCLTGLACAGLIDRGRLSWFGGLGIAASVVGGLFAVLTNWEFVTGWELLLKGRLSLLVIAIAFGHAALLLSINTSEALVKVARALTLSQIVMVALLLLLIIFAPGVIQVAWVWLAIASVLNVLGTVSTPILHFATRKLTSDSAPIPRAKVSIAAH